MGMFNKIKELNLHNIKDGVLGKVIFLDMYKAIRFLYYYIVFVYLLSNIDIGAFDCVWSYTLKVCLDTKKLLGIFMINYIIATYSNIFLYTNNQSSKKELISVLVMCKYHYLEFFIKIFFCG